MFGKIQMNIHYLETLTLEVLPTMFGKTQMNIHYLETLTLEVPFRYIISFSAAYKLSVYVYIGLHCLLPETAIRVEVFCKTRCS